MERFSITSPAVFYALGGLLVAYVLYMMIMRRKGEHSDLAGGGPEL